MLEAIAIGVAAGGLMIAVAAGVVARAAKTATLVALDMWLCAALLLVASDRSLGRVGAVAALVGMRELTRRGFHHRPD